MLFIFSVMQGKSFHTSAVALNWPCFSLNIFVLIFVIDDEASIFYGKVS